MNSIRRHTRQAPEIGSRPLRIGNQRARPPETCPNKREIQGLTMPGAVGRQRQRNHVVDGHYRMRRHHRRSQVGHVAQGAAREPRPERLLPNDLAQASAQILGRRMLLNREIGIPSLQGLEQRVEVLARPRVRKVPEVGVERDSQRAFLARLVVQVDAEASI